MNDLKEKERKANKRVDISGMKFGKLTVISRANDIVQPSGQIKTAWNCKCDCGNEIIVRTTDLKTGKKKSCGCYRKEFRVHDLTGKRFGKLTVLKKAIITVTESNGYVCVTVGNKRLSEVTDLLQGIQQVVDVTIKP